MLGTSRGKDPGAVFQLEAHCYNMGFNLGRD